MANNSQSASNPPANGSKNLANSALEVRPGLNVNKDLPWSPDEQAGLRDQHRQYTKELLGPAKPQEIDPNHAYPTVEDATTLNLCMLSYTI